MNVDNFFLLFSFWFVVFVLFPTLIFFLSTYPLFSLFVYLSAYLLIAFNTELFMCIRSHTAIAIAKGIHWNGSIAFLFNYSHCNVVIAKRVWYQFLRLWLQHVNEPLSTIFKIWLYQGLLCKAPDCPYFGLHVSLPMGFKTRWFSRLHTYTLHFFKFLLINNLWIQYTVVIWLICKSGVEKRQ